MGLIAPYVAKVLSYFAWGEESFIDFSSWLQSPFLPALHVLSVTLLIIFLIYKFANHRKSKRLQPDPPLPDNSDRSHTKSEHLVWINKILSWLFMSSTPLLPHFIKSWIDNLNLHMANQNRSTGALVYGLREGSAMPSLVEVKNVANVGNSVHADVLLRSTEFGFLITLENSERRNGMKETNFSAIVTHFECWFSLVFTNVNGIVGLILKPTEKQPVFQINMKPLAKRIPESVRPEYGLVKLRGAEENLQCVNQVDIKIVEVIAQSLREAVLETSVYANLDITNKQAMYESGTGSEKSFPPDSDPDVYSSGEIKPELCNEQPSAFNHRRFTNDHIHRTISAPGSPCPTPAPSFQPLSNTSVERGGSFGSLGNLTRTSSSGRVPAKPIRYREKSLLINEITFQPEKPGDFYPLLCTFELNHPPQNKTITLHKVSVRSTVTFDLSSRSSGLTITLESTTQSKENLHLKGSFVIDELNFDKDPVVKVLMGSDLIAGILQLKLQMKKNQDQIHSTQTNPRSNSFAKIAKSSTTKTESSTPNANDILNISGETKVTTVTTVTKSASGSPLRQETNTEPGPNQGVSFDESSVAEAALKDLSRKTSPARKTKILITAVETSSENPGSDVMEVSDFDNESRDLNSVDSNPESLKRNDNSTLSAASEPPPVVFTPSTPPISPESGYKEQSEVKIRRTRSLIFRGSRKSKEKRLSTMENADDSSASTPGIPSRGSATSLNRKPRGLSKIFGKKKKKLETLEDESSFADESLLSAGDGQIASPSDTPTKVKRRTSIKKLIKGKKKSEDT